MDIMCTDLMLIACPRSLLTLTLRLLALFSIRSYARRVPVVPLDSIILLFVFFRTLRISTVYLRLTECLMGHKN
ncbi:hypothetical protein BDZ89DRAFT_480989 [Hymenopellis radicata]|nr:hypothetical protein BDZ89DRAFT_480989 [Hymenopellis radicata]